MNNTLINRSAFDGLPKGQVCGANRRISGNQVTIFGVLGYWFSGSLTVAFVECLLGSFPCGPISAIIGGCTPLQILDTIIRPILVFVVYLGEIIGVRDKYFSDKSMNEKCIIFPVSAKNCTLIPIRLSKAIGHICCFPMFVRMALYSPHIGNFIFGEAGDWLPNFFTKHIVTI